MRRIRNSKNVVRTRLAFERGYRVEDDGSVSGPNGPIRPFPEKAGRAYGYLQISIRFINEPKMAPKKVYVHQLAAYQWFGDEAFAEHVEVRHLDGDRTNNSRVNIAIGSHHDNIMDMPCKERKRKASVAARHLRSLSDQQVQDLRKDRSEGMLLKDIAAKYGIAKSTASMIVNEVTYRGNTP